MIYPGTGQDPAPAPAPAPAPGMMLAEGLGLASLGGTAPTPYSAHNGSSGHMLDKTVSYP